MFSLLSYINDGGPTTRVNNICDHDLETRHMTKFTYPSTSLYIVNGSELYTLQIWEKETTPGNQLPE